MARHASRPHHVNAEVIVQTSAEDKNTTQTAQSDITDISHNPMPEKIKIDPFGYVDISAQTHKQNVTENAGGGIGNITATSQPMPKTSTQSKNMTRAPKAENIKPENITAKTGAHQKNDANETTKSARKSAADNKKNVTEAPAPPPLPHMPPAPDINANVNAINDQGDDKRVEEKRITYELFFDGHNEDIPNAQKELLGEKVDDIWISDRHGVSRSTLTPKARIKPIAAQHSLSRAAPRQLHSANHSGLPH